MADPFLVYNSYSKIGVYNPCRLAFSERMCVYESNLYLYLMVLNIVHLHSPIYHTNIFNFALFAQNER